MRKLVDSFGRVHNYLRISLTERCNLRCLYCMPAEGVPLQPDSHILTRAEISQLATHFVANGVNKIRLTGGEPTVRKDFLDIVGDLGAMDGVDKLAITTNGLALPRKLPLLKSLGLTGVNISLDTLVEAKFNFFTRRQGLHRVLEAIERAVAVGIPSVKINCVVMRNQNEDELADFVALTKDWPVQIRFIEYMPFDGNRWEQKKVMSYLEMRDAIEERGFSLTRLAHEPGETSKNFTVRSGSTGEKHAGTVGFITSMTSNFCGTCNRLRITADGNLKVCLFGNEEVSLRDLLRNGASDAEIQAVVELALHNKKEQHAGMDVLKDKKNRPMILIGGWNNETAALDRTALDRYMSPVDRIGSVFSSRAPSTQALLSKRKPFMQLRAYSTTSKLSHVDDSGEAHMVDISAKNITKRRATATGRICFSNDVALQQVVENSNKKGDVLGVARVAGIMAVKQTPNLIPLCHPLMTTKIKNHLILGANEIRVETTVECQGKTGVEMEALIGATVTLNTVYDMCKAVDKHMVITDLKVMEKQGGRHDFSLRSENESGA